QRVTELRTERCEIPYGPQPEPAEQPEALDAPLAPLLDWALHALASVGALTYGGGQATLTPLGSWAVWVKLEQICVAAQSPAGLGGSAVADEPTLRPYALLWLAEHDGVDPEDAHEVLTREEATWLWVDTAAAVADHGEAPMLVRHLESAVQPTVPLLLDEVRA